MITQQPTAFPLNRIIRAVPVRSHTVFAEIALAQIEQADLTPRLYRTARRLLDAVQRSDGGYASFDLETLMAVCRVTSQNGVERHLQDLQVAGLITARLGLGAMGRTEVRFAAWPGVGGVGA